MSDINLPPEFEDKVREAMDVPNASPEFVNKLKNELAGRPVKMKSRFVMKTAWVFAFVLVAITLIVSAPEAVNALKKLFGYVPGVGLVENTGNLRMLAEPVSMTRDGITITVTQVMVYWDRVELTYEVDGIKEIYSNAPTMCGSYHPDNNFWSDSDADLLLPDGTLVRRDYAGKYQFENRYSMKPIYAVKVPADVTEMTMLLKCIPFTKLGDAPENWELTFKLAPIPEGIVVGERVIEVEPTVVLPEVLPQAAANVPAPVVTMTLEKIVPMDERFIFYISMNMENADPSLISIMPANVYLIDSLGKKTQLAGNFVLQPFEHRVGTAFEYISESKPADGPLTIRVESVTMYYAPLYVDPPQATPDEMSFTFDAGENPERGQVWVLDESFNIGGYDLRVTSARAIVWEDVKIPEWTEGSQGFDFGYQFAVEADPSIKMDVEMDIMRDACGMPVKTNYVPEASSVLYNQLCRDEIPKGDVRVNLREFSVWIENTWQATWTPE